MRAEAKKTNYELNNVRGKKNDDQTAKEVRANKMKALFEGAIWKSTLTYSSK